MDNLWKKALSVLESEVNEQIFSAWFLPISLVDVDASSVTLGVPNKFYEDWLREKYISLISTAVNQASGSSLAVKFKIVDSPVVADAIEPSKETTSSKDTVQKRPKEKEAGGGWLKNVFAGTHQPPKAKVGLNARYTFDDFVVGQSNQFAHAAAMAVCAELAKRYNPLFLYGGVGLGKTHLMQAMGHEILHRHPRARVIYLSSEEFTNQLISAIRTKTTPKFRAMYRNADVLMIDDIQFIAGRESTQEEFFNTFNTLYDSHKQIVLCSDRPPKEIQKLEDRLVTRFAWGLTADIQAPDFETRIAIMEKKSSTEEVKVSKEVLYFLAENIKSNIREMEGALIRVVAYGKLTGQTIDIDLAKGVLKGMISDEVKKVNLDLIHETVADYFGINEIDMKSKKRTRAIAYPRQIAMYLSRELTEHSLPDIGGFFGRDHTTVLHACDKITKELASSDKTKATVDKLISLIKK